MTPRPREALAPELVPSRLARPSLARLAPPHPATLAVAWWLLGIVTAAAGHVIGLA